MERRLVIKDYNSLYTKNDTKDLFNIQVNKNKEFSLKTIS